MDTVQRYLEALQAPFALPASLPDLQALPRSGPTAFVFSPHPDDECVIGTLPLRLRREAHARVVNVAVTLGSNPERREPRRRELAEACRVLGFENIELGYHGVTMETRNNEPGKWKTWVDEAAQLIQSQQADLLILPHAHDLHPAHIGTHQLVMDALPKVRQALRLALVMTEFWHPMTDPNLMVEASAENLGILLAALVCHRGEVERNPYHLRLPGFMIDNTRRGLELIGGFGTGKDTPPFPFASLYRLIDGDEKDRPPAHVPAHQNIGEILT